MNLFALSGLLTGLSSLAFGYFVYWKGAHRPLNRLWFIFTVSVAVWGFGGMWIAIFFHHFVRTFCNLPGRAFMFFAYATGIAVFPLCFTNLFFSDVRFAFSSFYFSLPGAIFPLFTVWWVMMVVYSHYLLYKMHRV